MSIVLLRLQKLSCFHDLAIEFLQELAACAKITHWQAGTYLFRQNQPAEHFYLIESGLVALEIDAGMRGRMRLQTIEPDEILGWSWLYPPFLWHFDAHVLKEGQGLVFDAKEVRVRCENNFEFGYQIQKRFSTLIIERLQATRMQFLDLNREMMMTGQE